jgi:hypothetical protein
MRKVFLILFAVTLLVFLAYGYATPNQDDSKNSCVRGIVYNDANRNQVKDGFEKGIPDVCVSNGLEVVQTGPDGRYELPIDNDTIIFVIKPQDWKTPIDENKLPRFYYIHKPNGSPESKYPGVAPTGPLPDSVDFPLYHEKEPEYFRTVFFGDTQPRNQKEVYYIAHDVIEELKDVDAEFGVTLGDIVFDDLSIFDPLNETIALIGIPWYNVHGNHDTNQDSKGDKYSDETFNRIYGPAYYAFNYGPVHFIVLDDIAWDGDGYHGEFGERQLEFVKNDLAFVPEDKLVVVMMHIPLATVEDRTALFDLIEGRTHTLSLSAHWHQQRHIFFGGLSGWHGMDKHHHVVMGTVCGCWWQGAPDEYGIPHATMSDGTPNGYSFVTFDGNEYEIEYKVARSQASYQMNIYAPEEVASVAAGETAVLVNVFGGSEKSVVEMRLGEDGEWIKMKRVETEDPYILRIKEAEESEHPPRGIKVPDPNTSGHIWKGTLPSYPEMGTYFLHVRTTDMFKHVYEGRRVIRII